MKKNIYIFEDEYEISSILKDYLDNSGFEAKIFNTGEGAASIIKNENPDLVLLDIMLPGKDGLEICREVRGFSQVPIIMITAKVEEIDRLLGLELGADDYVCKPFSPREIVARVRAVLRRFETVEPSENVTLGNMILNSDTHNVSVGGENIVLTKSEFELLKIFMKHPEKVFSRSELVSSINGYEFEGYERTIDSHIKNIRKKLANHIEEEVIHTIYGVGYKLSLP